MCAIHRPLDDQTQLRVRLEAAAVVGILDRCGTSGLHLSSSDALMYEARRNPHPDRRKYVEAVLRAADVHQSLTAEVEARAAQLVDVGVSPLDALHVASAEAAGAAYFCTCDDRLLRAIRNRVATGLRAVTPLELVGELES
jgi:hypothetical protein